MEHNIIEDYVEKVYGYATRRTYSRDEADELAQEILFTAVRELPRLRDCDRFEPWLWGLADNVTKRFRRDMGKRRATYSYDVLGDAAAEDEYFGGESGENERLYDLLRTKVAMLSSAYRDIVVLHYYDGLSTKIISERLGIPEGTVRWRLSEARRKLKKELFVMEDTALYPKKMWIEIFGDGEYDGTRIPFPDVYIEDALSQNILYNCYERARGIEELAKICGVPAYYVEDRIENLVNRRAVIESPKGKYRTVFMILSDKHEVYCREHAEDALEPVMERLLDALDGIANEAAGIDFYRAEKSESDLYYLYGILAFEYMSRCLCRPPYPPIPENYDGFRWRYLAGEKRVDSSVIISTSRCNNTCSRGNCTHTVYANFGGVAYRPMMYYTYINVCEDILVRGKTDDDYHAACAISDGYIEKRADGSLFVTVPYFSAERMSEFEAAAQRYLAPLSSEYSAAVSGFIAGYKSLFPEHLSDDVERITSDMFVGMYKTVVEHAQRTGRIAPPSEGFVCDVMVERKKR